jgi:hypothetical protein
VWAVLGGMAWAPCTAYAAYRLLRTFARHTGEGQ